MLISKERLRKMASRDYSDDMMIKSVQRAEFSRELDRTKTYDIFLSHSYLDKEAIFLINDVLEKRMGLDVFVDWIEMPELSRDSVTSETASIIRSVMRRCKSLVYAISANSANSTWMPWELGYSDAWHQKVAVMPITERETAAFAYKGQEFLGIYPYVDVATARADNTHQFWTTHPSYSHLYTDLKEWVKTGVLNNH